MFGNNQNQGGGGGGLFGNQNKTGQQGGGGLFGNNQQQQGGGGGGGGLFGGGNQQQQQGGGGGGGLFGGGNQQQQQGGGGGGLFGNQNKTGQTGGGLFGGGNQQQQGGGGGGLFGGGQQQQQGGGGGGLFGGQQQQQGGGLFNKPTGQTGGGLFSGQSGQTGGGLFGGQQQQQGGGLFGGQGQSGSFSLMQQKPGQQGALFAGDMFAMGAKNNRYYLSLANSLRDKKVGSLNDKIRQPIEGIGKVLDDNKAKIERLKVDNQELIQKKDGLADNVYQFTQDTKQLYMKIRQARYLVDEMKSTLNTYEDITKSNFDHCLYLLKGGRPPNLEIPSSFMINITEYFDLRIRELKDKIEEIEELVKLTDLNEDSEDYEKIVIVLDELYNYYLNVAHKVFQLNEYIKDFKAQYIDYFKSQGSRDVEKIFVRAAPDAYKTEVLGRLETISNTILENKNKRLQEESKKVTTKLTN